jgi:hypothetical protein
LNSRKQLHHFERRGTQIVDAFPLFVLLVEGLPTAQFGLDFLVGGQGIAISGAQSPRRLALGGTVIGDTVFRHQARCRTGNGAPATGLMWNLRICGAAWGRRRLQS